MADVGDDETTTDAATTGRNDDEAKREGGAAVCASAEERPRRLRATDSKEDARHFAYGLTPVSIAAYI